MSSNTVATSWPKRKSSIAGFSARKTWSRPLAAVPMGILAHPVDDPKSYGIIFRNPDGTLNRVVEKPEGLTPPQLANIGGYMFPKSVFDLTLPLSPRGEYEITDAVSVLAARQPFYAVEAQTWLPIGDEAAWRAAEQIDLEGLLLRR